MPSPLVTATFQAAGLSTASNICAQFIDAYQKSTVFSLDLVQLIRFVALAFLTAPPNYHWQQFLERSFPAYLNADGTAGVPGDAGRAKDDIEMKAGVANDIVGVGSGDASEQRGEGAGSGKFSLKNTLTKWFIDCITMGAIMNTVAFLVLMGLMKGQAWAQISSNIRTVRIVSFRPFYQDSFTYSLTQETIPIIVAGYKIWPIASIISFSFIPVHRRIVFLSFIGLLWGIYMSLVAARV